MKILPAADVFRCSMTLLSLYEVMSLFHVSDIKFITHWSNICITGFAKSESASPVLHPETQVVSSESLLHPHDFESSVNDEQSRLIADLSEFPEGNTSFCWKNNTIFVWNFFDEIIKKLILYTDIGQQNLGYITGIF